MKPIFINHKDLDLKLYSVILYIVVFNTDKSITIYCNHLSDSKNPLRVFYSGWYKMDDLRETLSLVEKQTSNTVEVMQLDRIQDRIKSNTKIEIKFLNSLK